MSEPQQNASSSGKPTLALVVLAAIIVVAALLVFRGGTEPVRLPPEKPKLSEAQDIRRVVEGLLETAPVVEGSQSISPIEKARELMAAYVHATPGDVEIRPLLARTLIKLNRPADAELTVDDALRIAPQIAELEWLKGELVKARGGTNYMKFFANAAAATEGSGPEIWTRYALELLAAGNDAQAATYLQKAGDAGFKDARLEKGLGQLAYNRKDFPKAQKQLQIALDFRPIDSSVRSDPSAWRMLADCQIHMGATTQAADTLQQALDNCQVKSGLFMDLGYARMGLGQMRQAGDAFARAADARDLRPVASLQAAKAYYAAGQEMYAAAASQPTSDDDFRPYALAMKYIDQAVNLDGDTPEIIDLRAKIEDARFGPATRQGN